MCAKALLAGLFVFLSSIAVGDKKQLTRYTLSQAGE
jgi:hypothetical protein